MAVSRLLNKFLLLCGAGVVILSLGCPKPPHVPDKPTGPGVVQFGSTASYATQASNPGGGEVRYQFDWGDGTSSNWTAYVQPDSLVSDTHAFSRTTGPLSIRARAQNTKNATSAWSEALSVSVVSGETTLKWVYAYLDEGDTVGFWGSPAMSQSGYIWAVSELGILHVIQNDGGRRSSYSTVEQDDFTNGPAIGADEVGYISGSDTTLYGIRVNGTRALGLPFPYDVTAALAIGPDRAIYIQSEGDSLYRMDSTGRRWAAYTGGGSSSPVITADGALVIVGGGDGVIHAFSTLDGTLAWSWLTGMPVSTGAAIGTDGTIYMGSENGSLYAMKPDGGGPSWQYAANSPVATSPAIGPDGVVYFASDDGVLHAVDPANQGQSAKWTRAMHCEQASTPALDNSGRVYLKALYGNEDSLLAINTADGTPRWSRALPSLSEQELVSSPLIDANGTIYIATGVGVYALFGQSGPAQSSWPMFQHDMRRTGWAGAQ